jgi:hypothetical protein
MDRYYRVKIECSGAKGTYTQTLTFRARSKAAARTSAMASHGPCKVLEVARFYP